MENDANISSKESNSDGSGSDIAVKLSKENDTYVIIIAQSHCEIGKIELEDKDLANKFYKALSSVVE